MVLIMVYYGTLSDIRKLIQFFPPRSQKETTKSSRHIYRYIKQSTNKIVLRERNRHQNTNLIDRLELVKYSQSLSQTDNLPHLFIVQQKSRGQG